MDEQRAMSILRNFIVFPASDHDRAIKWAVDEITRLRAWQEANGTAGTPQEPRSLQKARERPDEVPIPPQIDTEAMREAIAEWFAYRKTIRKPLKSAASWRAQLLKFVQWGEHSAIESIRTSIANEYQGLFYPKGNGHARNPDQHIMDTIAGAFE